MTCPACLEDINPYTTVILGRCGHCFCSQCWDKFERIHKKDNPTIPAKCPLCKCIIHNPSVIRTNAARNVRNFFQSPLIEENNRLRNLISNIVNLNRRQLGQWKYDYKLLTERTKNICDQEENSRDIIKSDYAYELIEYRTTYSAFLSSIEKMRNQMKNLTKKYKSPPRQREMPPDPVDIIPPELVDNTPNGIQLRAWTNQSLPSNLLSNNLMIGSILQGLSSSESSSL